jgi:hypothetical protein
MAEAVLKDKSTEGYAVTSARSYQEPDRLLSNSWPQAWDVMERCLWAGAGGIRADTSTATSMELRVAD